MSNTPANRARPKSFSLITIAAHKSTPYREGIHFHAGYEIILVRKGEIEVSTDRRTFRVAEGTLLFFSNLENHRIRVLREPYERYFLNLDTSVCDKTLSDKDLISLLKCRPLGFEHGLPLGALTEKIVSLFESILTERAEGGRFSSELCEGYVKEILMLAFRTLPADKTPEENRMRDLLYRIREHLDAHFTEDIRIKALCDAHYTNHYYLTHCFKEYTGYSPKQYLTRLRLYHAIRLFTVEGYTVSAAAVTSGFSNVNNFIRAFRGEFGMTPTEYKKRHVRE